MPFASPFIDFLQALIISQPDGVAGSGHSFQVGVGYPVSCLVQTRQLRLPAFRPKAGRLKVRPEVHAESSKVSPERSWLGIRPVQLSVLGEQPGKDCRKLGVRGSGFVLNNRGGLRVEIPGETLELAGKA